MVLADRVDKVMSGERICEIVFFVCIRSRRTKKWLSSVSSGSDDTPVNRKRSLC